MNSLLPLLAVIFFVLLVAAITVVLLVLAFRSGREGTAPRHPIDTGDTVEVVRLVRDQVSEMLLVSIDGNPPVLPAALNPKQKKLLDSVIDELFTLMGKEPHAASQPPPPVILPAEPPSAEPPTIASVPDPDPTEKPSLRRSLFDTVARAAQLDAPKPPPQRTIAQQVDAVLQEMLLTSPLRLRGIRISDSPNGTLVMHVGMDKYYSIDEIPEPDVRAILQAAVDEWRKRTS